MHRYIIRRLLLNIPVLFGVTLLVFSLIRILPGDVVTSMVAESGNVSQADMDKLRERLGLDRPFHEQYLHWVAGIFRGDFGESLRSGIPVSERLFNALPISFELGILAISLALVIAIPAGIISALYRNSPIDYGSRLFSIMGLSMPSFWIGTLVVVLPAIWWGYLPPLTFIPFFDNPVENIKMMLLPALVLGFSASAVTARMVRSMMLEVLREDYIRTAWAKGLRQRVIILRHALKNAFIPVITIVGRQFGILFGGTVILESIFSLPGLGRLTLDSINQRDYPQIQANALFFAVALVMLNLLVDLTYGWLDPRIRYQ